MGGGALMFPSEAIKVIERTPRVVIVDPPQYSFGVGMLCFAIVRLGAAAFFYSRNLMAPNGWASLAVGVALGLFAIFLVTSHRRITLSRSDGKLSVEKSSFGMTSTEGTATLSNIKHATVET